MKLLTYICSKCGKERVGVLSSNGEKVYPLWRMGFDYESMNELIQKADKEELAKIAAAAAKAEEGEGGKKFEETKMIAPIPVPIQDVICLGINYADHAVESARYKKELSPKVEYATYFAKRVARAVGHGEPIDGHSDFVERLDYEVELAVIIGKDARDVAEEDAFDYVFGYTVLNDVSARDLQTRHNQWYFGKSLDGFTPMGPWIVTEDEFARPPVLKITSKVNGELRQDSMTDRFIHSIPEVISELSRGITLKAGTIISMGTPSGVGMGFQPPKFLSVGDVVTCEIEGIGVLENTVK